jgi:hypothetical protein
MDIKELRAKLEWLATAKVGDPLPDWLGGPDFGWGPPISEIAAAALDRLPNWRPVAEIESVMLPWSRELPASYLWRGLIQMPKHGVADPWICGGWAYWFKSRHPNSTPTVRWASSNGLCTPEFFQPFPEAKGGIT